MIKKIIVGIVVFVLLAWVFEKISNYLSPPGPELDKIVIDSLYNNSIIKSKLGELKSYDMRYDSVTEDYSFTKFRIAVQGQKKGSQWKGTIVKQDSSFTLIDLVEE